MTNDILTEVIGFVMVGVGVGVGVVVLTIVWLTKLWG